VPATHSYQLLLSWTGNRGPGTSSYRAYTRDHELQGSGKPAIAGSADPAFRGDPHRWNPEELLVASLAQCHMLWYLHLAATAGVIVTAYSDAPTGTMIEDADGGGQFSEVVLRPTVTVAEAAARHRAHALHDEVDALCFIARSVRFPVRHHPTTLAAGEVLLDKATRETADSGPRTHE
jgi:organic hydroperoxide reductase OsmC/OhrA